MWSSKDFLGNQKYYIGNLLKDCLCSGCIEMEVESKTANILKLNF